MPRAARVSIAIDDRCTRELVAAGLNAVVALSCGIDAIGPATCPAALDDRRTIRESSGRGAAWAFSDSERVLSTENSVMVGS